MQVKWLTAAEDDLREIARRMALNFGYVTAEQTVASVTEETQRLADFPEIGRLCDEYEGSRRVEAALVLGLSRAVAVDVDQGEAGQGLPIHEGVDGAQGGNFGHDVDLRGESRLNCQVAHVAGLAVSMIQ